MLNSFKLKKSVMALSLITLGTFSVMGEAQAQWSVIDVNSNAIKQNLEKGLTSIKNALDAVAKNQETQVKQTDQYQEDTDKRVRLASGLQETLRRDLEAQPTLRQCAEMTDRALNGAGYRASLAGASGGAGSKSQPGSFLKGSIEVKNEGAALGKALKGVVEAKTCDGAMDSAINGCSGEGKYATADVNSNALKKDFASKSAEGIMTNTLGAEAKTAALVNINNATLHSAPPSLEVNEAKKNPVYVAVYKSTMTKLQAAYEALHGIASLRFAASAMPGGYAGNKWDQEKADYKETFGVDAPAIPSFFEALNFSVMRDYVGPKTEKEESMNEKDLLLEINNRLRISNVIAIQQFQATETSNILLAHLLTQSVTPVDINNVKSEAARTKNLKAN